MTGNKFTEEDKQKLIDYLNLVAKHARFDFDTNESIKHFHLLSYMQQVLLPKINANILEIKRVIEDPKPEKKSKKKGK